MSGSGSPNFLVTLLIGTAVAGGVYWAFGKLQDKRAGAIDPPNPSALTAPERDALDVVRKMNDLKAFEGAVSLMAKKNEVRTAVDTAVMTAGKIFDEAAFEAAWNRIPEADRQNKSADELADAIAAQLK